MKSTTPNLTGMIFGKLNVIRFDRYTKHAARWWCRCSCGVEKSIAATALQAGLTISCGCVGQERRRLARVTHGQFGTRPYKIWAGVIQRCKNPNETAFRHYGGRGIDVCPEWRMSFENFWSDMSGGYDPDKSLERIDNNGGYSKENCRWATRTEQARNTRRNRILTIDGITAPLAAHAERAGIPQDCLGMRLKRGWAPEHLLKPKNFRPRYNK